MKNCCFLFSLLFFFFLATDAQAQTGSKAYWEREAERMMAKADRVIHHYNKQTKVFTPAELRMMRTDPRRFTNLANARSQRYSQAKQQYERMYDRDWVNSFRAMGPKRVIVRPQVVQRPVRRPVPVTRYRRY